MYETLNGGITNIIAPLQIENNQNLTIAFLLLGLLFVGLVVSSDLPKVKLLFSSMLAEGGTSMRYGESFSISNRSTLFLLANYVVLAGLLWLNLVKSGVVGGLGVNPSILTFLLFISGLMLIKRLVIKVTGYLFLAEAEVAEYLFNQTVFTALAGILLLPLLVLANFSFLSSPVFLKTIGFFLVSLFITRLLKMIWIGIKQLSGGVYYLILYICTLEILPLVVIYSLFVGELS